MDLTTAIHGDQLPDQRQAAIVRDAHPRPAAEDSLAISEDGLAISEDSLAISDESLLKRAIEHMAPGLLMLDAHQRIIALNRQYLAIYGLAPDMIAIGATARDVVEQAVRLGNYPGHTVETAWAAASARLAEQQAWRIQQRLGNGRVVAIAYEPMPGGGWVTTHLDVTERQEAEDRLTFLARHDALTGLANRTLVLQRLEQQLATGGCCAVYCLDLDRFKAVNDTLGHAAGDELLRQVAARLRGCVRESDTVARFGGDEFAIVQSHLAGPGDATALAARIVAAIAAPFAVGFGEVGIGASVGVAIAPQDGSHADTLLLHADTALYRAKHAGRGTFRLFDREMIEHLEKRRLLEYDLRAAVEGDALDLHYQPMFDIASRTIIGFEALLHWHHPVRGVVSPSEFIPVAEEAGLIEAVGGWVLRRACRDAVDWPDGVFVAVNVSSLQFRNERLVSVVDSAVTETGLGPRRLELEITETLLLQNSIANLATLRKLRERGVRIAMDDFGTGYSSLSYLRSFPFDKIKIDRSFVAGLPDSLDCRAIVRASAALGHSLGMRVLAEGVETPEQLSCLSDCGCSSAQGYFFSRPVPAQEVPIMLTQRAHRRLFAGLDAARVDPTQLDEARL